MVGGILRIEYDTRRKGKKPSDERCIHVYGTLTKIVGIGSVVATNGVGNLFLLSRLPIATTTTFFNAFL